MGRRTRNVETKGGDTLDREFGFVAGDNVEGYVSMDGLESMLDMKRETGGGPDFGPRWLNWLSREWGSISTAVDEHNKTMMFFWPCYVSVYENGSQNKFFSTARISFWVRRVVKFFESRYFHKLIQPWGVSLLEPPTAQWCGLHNPASWVQWLWTTSEKLLCPQTLLSLQLIDSMSSHFTGDIWPILLTGLSIGRCGESRPFSSGQNSRGTGMIPILAVPVRDCPRLDPKPFTHCSLP